MTVYCVGVEPIISSSYCFVRIFFKRETEAAHRAVRDVGSSKMLASIVIGGAAEELAQEPADGRSLEGTKGGRVDRRRLAGGRRGM